MYRMAVQPFVTNPDVVQINDDTVIFNVTTAKVPLKRCKQLFKTSVEDRPKKMDRLCNMTYATVEHGRQLVKDVCVGYCNDECPKRVPCKAKLGFLIVDPSISK